ncbi:MAG: hypothetical protein KOO60_13045, partial [Gemmatimonadales bacterium]|nr:hypothetical protein [Gemmatimonadales bacterium]
FITFLAGTMALSGVPFLAGFYSKDGILGSALAFGMTDGHYLPFILGIMAALLTPFYMFRLVFRTFFGKPADQEKFDHAHESPLSMTIPLMILGVLSVCAAGWQTADKGWFSKFTVPYDVPAIAAEFHIEGPSAEDHLAVDGHAEDSHAADAGHGAGHEIAHGDHHGDHHDVHHTAHIRAMYMSIAMVIFGIGGAWFVYHQKKVNTAAIQQRLKGGYNVLQGQYFFDEFYAATVYRFTLWWADLCAAFDRVVVDGIVNGTGYMTRMVSWISGTIDRFIVDGAVNGIAAVLHGAGEGIRRVQTGRVQTYLTYVSGSVLVLILIYNVL